MRLCANGRFAVSAPQWRVERVEQSERTRGTRFVG
jgi:hypothetical protein